MRPRPHPSSRNR